MKKQTTATGILILIALAGGVFYLYHSSVFTNGVQVGVSADTVSVAPLLKPERIPPIGYKEYRSEFYKFQLFYPEALSVTTYQEKGSAITVTFQNTDRSQEFQIFITPYGGTDITETRIKVDNPSGIINERQDIMIDGAKALAFFGSDKILGETREVWFINRGFLYEVTTYKKLDAWLAAIMQSWQFL